MVVTFDRNIHASGLLMFPNDPVTVIFMMLTFVFVRNKGIFVLTFIQVLTLKYVP